MDNFTELVAAARKFLRQMEKIRGNEHWTDSDEIAYRNLEESLPPE